MNCVAASPHWSRSKPRSDGSLSLIPAGLGVAYLIKPASIDAHLIGGLIGLIAFALIALLYQMLRGREGLGMGDAILLPGVVLLATFTAVSLAVLRLIIGNRSDVNEEIAFGPHIALAFWAS